MKLRGIDVSSWQERPSWPMVKQDGVQFVMLRCHQKTGIDASFEYNYKNARAQELPVGVYKYSYAKNEAEAVAEAQAVLETLGGRPLQLPVFFDLEEDFQFNMGSKAVEIMALAFLSVIEKSGYKVGIYCNDDWYNNILTDKLKKYDLWIAHPYSITDEDELNRLKPPYCVMWQYSFAGKVRGIDGKVDMDFLYKDYLEEVNEPMQEVTAEDVLKIMRSWVGLSRANGTHKPIIDIYNSQSSLPRGWKVTYTDAYCNTTVSAAFIKAGNTDIIGGTECGVEQHVAKFIKEGIWNENGSIVPKVGDIIVYNWDDSTQPNDGDGDHIGIVEKVDGNTITVIEGNMSGGVVGRRYVPVAWGYIRGYARPKYYTGERVQVEKTVDELAKEVIQGKWGDSTERVTALMNAGYDPALVQNRVNELLLGTAPAKTTTTSSGSGLNKTPKFTGRVTANALNVRTWAGISFARIKSYPQLTRGNLIDVCDTVKASDGSDWYYIRIAGQFYGFVSSAYVERV